MMIVPCFFVKHFHNLFMEEVHQLKWSCTSLWPSCYTLRQVREDQSMYKNSAADW